MSAIQVKPLTAFQPVELLYNYKSNEPLQSELISYQDGYSLYVLQGLDDFQDQTINRQTCFILTSALALSGFFAKPVIKYLGEIPGSFYLQPRNTPTYYITYNELSNTFSLTQDITVANKISINPIPNSEKIELIVNNQFLEVDREYPYLIRLSPTRRDESERGLQLFTYSYNNGFLTLQINTPEGGRFLSTSSDGILRANGVILGTTVLNDYVFRTILETTDEITQGFLGDNNWVSYYYNYKDTSRNKDVTLNQSLPVDTHLLIDFPVEKAVESGVVSINVANLKTYTTPTGTPVSLINSIDGEQPIT